MRLGNRRYFINDVIAVRVYKVIFSSKCTLRHSLITSYIESLTTDEYVANFTCEKKKHLQEIRCTNSKNASRFSGSYGGSCSIIRSRRTVVSRICMRKKVRYRRVSKLMNPFWLTLPCKCCTSFTFSFALLPVCM